MPEAATANMGLILPTDHADGNVWGALMASVWALVDAHDHSAGKGARVPSSALKINADVSWSFAGTNYAITALKAVDFTPVAAASVASYSSALFTSSADSNLYFRNSVGTNVKITDGSTLNVSIVGGIGGDYSSIGALLDYDDASDTYRLRQETSAGVRQFAKVRSADLQLAEYIAAGGATVPTTFVTLKSPTALAGSYDMTMPAALPTSTAVVQLSAAGVLTASNTIANDVALGAQLALTGDISPTAITATTDVNDYNPTGLSTASTIRQIVTNAGPGATFNLTGLAGGSDGRVIVLHSLGTQAADGIVLMHENAGSAAANRFSLANATNLTLTQFRSVVLQYDSISARWRVVGKNF